MISIIICSAQKHLLDNVSKNIAATIGTPYELIAVDNSKGEMGICQAYNKGAKQAKYPVLCFMHEDLDIKTKDWGAVVLDAFHKNANLGIVGVVGNAYKSKAPTGWDSGSFDPELVSCNYIQQFKFSNKPAEHVFVNPLNEQLSSVATVDGMWFCTTREIVEKYPFDEKLFKDFHCYDLDFCFQVGQTHELAVTFNVLIEHFSEGSYKKTWWLDTLKLHDKWQEKLPIDLRNLPRETKFQIEKEAYLGVVYLFKEIGYSNGELLSFYFKEKLKGRVGWQIYFKCNKLVLKHVFGMK